MTPASHSPGGEHQPRIVRQDWDTRHFGFPVARLEGTAETDELLARALEQARSSGFVCVYWFAESDRTVSAEILDRFGGTRVRQRVEFVRPLTRKDALIIGDEIPPVRVFVCPPFFPPDAPEPSLLKLAERAGNESRFHADTRFAPDRVRELYHTWLARSLRREIAKVVFLAQVEGLKNAGIVTITARIGIAEIGLLAVDPRARSRGVASELLKAVFDWGLANGLSEATVVTYLENEPACRLYRRAGFQMTRTQQVFHFWL